jgi:anti-sigma B factor antagonist
MTGHLSVQRLAPSQVVLELSGEHDLARRDELRDVLTALVGGHDLVIVDLSGATFIDSSVLSSLISADRLARDRGSVLRIQLGSADIVHKVLEISGLLDHLECVSDRETALSPG